MTDIKDLGQCNCITNAPLYQLSKGERARSFGTINPTKGNAPNYIIMSADKILCNNHKQISWCSCSVLKVTATMKVHKTSVTKAPLPREPGTKRTISWDPSRPILLPRWHFKRSSATNDDSNASWWGLHERSSSGSSSGASYHATTPICQRATIAHRRATPLHPPSLDFLMNETLY